MNSTKSDTISLGRNMIKGFTVIIAVVLIFAFMSTDLRASAATTVTKLKAPTIVPEVKYDSAETHPYNKQTNTIIVDWNDVKNAAKYELYIKGGNYDKYTKYKTVASSKCTVTGLTRCTNYKFKVRAVKGSVKSDFSEIVTIKTARMDYDKAGWEAMCRVITHEVGGMDGDIWDKPIVYAADCIANAYTYAKYTNHPIWTPYFRKYNSIQQVLYTSGGYISDAALTRRGVTYSKVPEKVKLAVYGAVYCKAAYKGINNNFSIFWWRNTSYRVTSSNVSYCFAIPWGGYGCFYNKYWA